MKKFIVHYHSPAEAMAQMANATPEQKAAGMKPWMDWKESMGDKLIEMGSPLMGAQRINADGSTAQKQSEVTGYSIIQANDIEEAKTILKSHPHLQWADNVAIEIFETIAM